ncbi:MAG: hypothetical protein Q9227_004442 [Pyrenula ochraceoflavens]
MVNVIFAYIGMDIVAATASESKALVNCESMKMAARKISLRVVTLYVMAVLTASFLVPRDHPFLNGKGQSVGSHSIFIIAVVEAGLPGLAHFCNAVFVVSSFTCAINSILEDVKTYGNASEVQAATYDRNHPQYPYKSHGQWLKACYGMVACLILLLFNGVAPFLEDPFDVRRFIASYISVSFRCFPQ